MWRESTLKVVVELAATQTQLGLSACTQATTSSCYLASPSCFVGGDALLHCNQYLQCIQVLQQLKLPSVPNSL